MAILPDVFMLQLSLLTAPLFAASLHEELSHDLQHSRNECVAQETRKIIFKSDPTCKVCDLHLPLTAWMAVSNQAISLAPLQPETTHSAVSTF